MGEIAAEVCLDTGEGVDLKEEYHRKLNELENEKEELEYFKRKYKQKKEILNQEKRKYKTKLEEIMQSGAQKNTEESLSESEKEDSDISESIQPSSPRLSQRNSRTKLEERPSVDEEKKSLEQLKQQVEENMKRLQREKHKLNVHKRILAGSGGHKLSESNKQIELFRNKLLKKCVSDERLTPKKKTEVDTSDKDDSRPKSTQRGKLSRKLYLQKPPEDEKKPSLLTPKVKSRTPMEKKKFNLSTGKLLDYK